MPCSTTPHATPHATGRLRLVPFVALVLQAVAGGPRDAGAQTPAGGPSGAAGRIDWKAVDAAMGRTGADQPGNVRRYGMPRADLRVSVRGVVIRPGFALGSWLAMTPMHGASGDSARQPRVMAMGDMVLKESEVAPVMTALQAGGVEQTAVHHHVLHETPRVVYMHVHATGDPVRIAQTVRTALGRTSTPSPCGVMASHEPRANPGLSRTPCTVTRMSDLGMP